MGNPVSYGDYITYTWNGRQLLEYKNSDPGDYIRCVYTYDADGLRTRKLVYRQKSSTDTTEYLSQQYDYVWKDGILDSEKYVIYNNNGSVYQSIVYKYFYDEYSSPIGIALWIDGEKNGNYWYIKNAQGDVTSIYREGYGIVINYYYDAYGNVSYTVGDYDDFEGVVNAVVMVTYNNLTYRGYYYDRDINMYYLQSRYYSPTWGRFINADDVEYLGVSGTALSYNLYAYCENDPVNSIDPSGYVPPTVIKAILGAFLGGILQLITDAIEVYVFKGVWSSLGDYISSIAISAWDAVTNSGLFKQILVKVGANIINQIYNKIVRKSDFSTSSIYQTIIMAVVEYAFGKLLAGRTPKFIRDIKKEVDPKVVRGTKKLTAYLNKKIRKVELENIAISKIIDVVKISFQTIHRTIIKYMQDMFKASKKTASSKG